MMRTTANYFLEGLQEIGVEYLFCNFGTDHVSIIEEVARWQREGRQAPNIILCPHENVAVHMACGYAMATGRGQAVLVHVDVGTANAVMGLHNLWRSRVPLLLFAGKAPYTLRGELPGSRDSFVNFIQEPYDMASLVRPYVKWTYDLPAPIMVKEGLRRAHSLMQSDPQGPVFMSAAREVLAAECPSEQVPSFPAERYGPVAAAGIDETTVEDIARRLLAAKHPLLISAYAGRNPACVPIIDELAQLTGMRVFESNPIYLNIPHDSPCFGGYAASDAVAEADFGLMIDVDVPWVPKFARENPDSFWVHIDVDVIKKDIPMWGFPSHLRIQADSCKALQRLLALVKETASAQFLDAARQRVAAWERQRATATAAARAALAPAAQTKITAAFVAARLNEVMADDDILVHEAITNVVPLLQQIERNRPGTLFGNGGSGLGFGGGAALGAKLAYPERTVFHVTGDASFCFSGPTPVYMVAKQYALPIFSVVLDNGGWGAVKGATLRVYPQGEANSADSFQARVASDMHYEKVAEAAGAYGERVDQASALPAAIARCLAQVKAGRSAVLVVRLEPI